MLQSALRIKKETVLLNSSEHEFEREGVLNPAILQDGDTLHVYYRAVRPGNFSTLGYCRLQGPLDVVERLDHPLIEPTESYESHGLEDPRVVKIDDTIYINYTGYDGQNALGAICTGTDPTHFIKAGTSTPLVSHKTFVEYLSCIKKPLNGKYFQEYDLFRSMGGLSPTLLVWDKDTVMFPEKINGKFAMLHRIWPGIQIVYFDSLDDLKRYPWEHYLTCLTDYIVMDPFYPHESSHIGAGCPPIKTPHGWLVIYHAVRETAHGKQYTAAAALLDLVDPRIEIGRLRRPLFAPDEAWERRGVVNNVVFPCGTSLFGDTLYIYYGAADQRIGVASISFSTLIEALLHTPKTRTR